MAELEISIDPKGNVTSKTDGVKGRKCLEVDDFLKELGKVEVKKTKEFYDDKERVVLIRPGA
jgi:hypothetical protein